MTHLAPRRDLAAEPAQQVAGPSRRQVLVSGGVVVTAAALCAACGSTSSSGAAAAPAGGAYGGGAAAAPSPTSPTASAPNVPAATGATVSTADVPVGGGTVLADQKIVVTQPKAGVFKAFTAVCTHQGCVVASVAAGVIQCPCHGSQYSITTGAVKAGPAPAPLASLPVTVSGTTVTVA